MEAPSEAVGGTTVGELFQSNVQCMAYILALKKELAGSEERHGAELALVEGRQSALLDIIAGQQARIEELKSAFDLSEAWTRLLAFHQVGASSLRGFGEATQGAESAAASPCPAAAAMALLSAAVAQEMSDAESAAAAATTSTSDPSPTSGPRSLVARLLDSVRSLEASVSGQLQAQGEESFQLRALLDQLLIKESLSERASQVRERRLTEELEAALMSVADLQAQCAAGLGREAALRERLRQAEFSHSLMSAELDDYGQRVAEVSSAALDLADLAGPVPVPGPGLGPGRGAGLGGELEVPVSPSRSPFMAHAVSPSASASASPSASASAFPAHSPLPSPARAPKASPSSNNNSGGGGSSSRGRSKARASGGGGGKFGSPGGSRASSAPASVDLAVLKHIARQRWARGETRVFPIHGPFPPADAAASASASVPVPVSVPVSDPVSGSGPGSGLAFGFAIASGSGSGSRLGPVALVSPIAASGPGFWSSSGSGTAFALSGESGLVDATSTAAVATEAAEAEAEERGGAVVDSGSAVGARQGRSPRVRFTHGEAGVGSSGGSGSGSKSVLGRGTILHPVTPEAHTQSRETAPGPRTSTSTSTGSGSGAGQGKGKDKGAKDSERDRVRERGRERERERESVGAVEARLSEMAAVAAAMREIELI